MNRPPPNCHSANHARHNSRAAPPALHAPPASPGATPSAFRAQNSADAPLPAWVLAPFALHTGAQGAKLNPHTGAERANLGLNQQQAATATESAARERLPNHPTHERTGLNGQRTGQRPKQQPHVRAKGGGPAAGGLRGGWEALGGAGLLLLLALLWV
jgi:hypothetical protein